MNYFIKTASVFALFAFVGVGCVLPPSDEKEDGRVLVTSPDNNFVLRGVGTCAGLFEIFANENLESATGLAYDLSVRDHVEVSESQDLGSVIVQTPEQFQNHKLGGFYKTSFQNSTTVVSSVITDAATIWNDTSQVCEVTVTQK
ncbi:hypothetical protein A2318_01590 [Candidatus Uhrbacteria bacterium RIFOXYB2_FULL_45_11]|uniref:Lipoprotein n=1 Tax=Candidatus Uhrbacteria bacterium RIFOXYB2_FULL_45_11 TaxID=1802421 RepID=A0A1F7WA04_9BACT|nr:MAG: hypothetical protein A2318_01590 [Candidatus Uhrbacteria bacterium RIFOXYB2_FULL_45_11]